MKCSAIFILLGLLALTQAEDDETMALVRSCKTIQDCHLNEFSDFSFFFFVLPQLLLALICISIVLKKDQMTNDRRLKLWYPLSNINCLKKAISAH